MSIKFVILGSDENAYGMSRVIYKTYKEKPLVLCSRILYPTMFSKIVDIKVIENFDTESVCIKSLINVGETLKKTTKNIILIPCSDSYMEYVVKNQDLLSGLFLNKFISYNLLKSFITKDKFYNLCDKYKLRYPKSVIIKESDRLDILKKIHFKYPLILKPNNSNSSEYLHAEFPNKKKVFLIKSETELIQTVNNINKSNYKDNLIVQEFIKGDDTNNLVINAYSSTDGKVRMMGIGRPVLEEYHPKVLGNYAAIISEVGYKEVMNDVKKFLENIKYVGFSNFDFKYNEIDKKYYCFEINYRQGRSSYFLNECGVNLIELLTDDLVYKKRKDIIYPTKKILWLNVPYIVIKKYINNTKVLEEISELKNKKEVYHTLFDKEDLSLIRYINLKKVYFSKTRQYKKYFIKKG